MFCIDSICFHAGGPLALGDIEEINNKQCLVCPWHFYHCSLEDGQKFYRQATMQEGRPMPGAWQSVGVRQRTHEVEERGDGIYVRLSATTANAHAGSDKGHVAIESDRYAFEQETGDRIWMLSRAGQGSKARSMSGNSSPRSTPPASPRRDRGSISGGFGGVSSESEEVWPVVDSHQTHQGDVSSRAGIQGRRGHSPSPVRRPLL